MENEIVNLEEKEIEIKIGSIEFKGYEHIKEKALKLSENLNNVEVNEENVAESKKIIAAVNKDIKKLEDRRIAIKKEILKPYDKFEKQVKEIVEIVKRSEEIVKNQIKELEEKDKEKKKNEIKIMFEERINNYIFNSLIKFDDFFEERMSNKTTSLNKLEIELNMWLEQRKMDIEVINTQDNSTEILQEYLKSFNLADSIATIKSKYEESKKIEEVLGNNKVVKKYIFIINDEKDGKLTEMLLKENKIQYIMEVK